MFIATKIKDYLKLMRQRGISARQLLAGTQIDAKKLADIQYCIPREQYETVLSNMIKLTGDAGIAFSLSEIPVNFSELGMLGYAMLSASTLRAALAVRIEYSDSIEIAPISIASYTDVHSGFEVVVACPPHLDGAQRFEIEEMLVQSNKRAAYLSGAEPVMKKISLSYPKPAHSALYRKFCKCPVEFNAPQTVFRFLEPGLDSPIQTRNDELFDICAEHCRQIMEGSKEGSALRGRLRRMFLSTPANLPDLDQAGAALGVSVSTLRRRLEARGLSYQVIKDEFRYNLASGYLRTGHMSAKQVTFLLGFSTPSNFSRAFKEWSGVTVGKFLSLSGHASKPH